jgi:protein-disulfide isomerase-like protein with CxxC motif
MLEITEYTDPICSWAWGSEPKIRRLRWRFEAQVSWRLVLGGLVGDNSSRRDDWDPVKAAQPMSDYWKRVTKITGAPYPVEMHYMLRSTNPVGRAVKAAQLQGDTVGQAALRRFRESTFLFGRPPGARQEILNSVGDLPGLDLDQFAADLDGRKAAVGYDADWAETRKPNDHVRNLTGDRPGIGDLKHSEGHDRYAFPTFIFKGPGGEHTVPGWMDYTDYEAAMESASPGSTSAPRPDPTPDEGFSRWPLLTPIEFETLCGPDATVPAGVVTYDWGDGVVFLTNTEAKARGIG